MPSKPLGKRERRDRTNDVLAFITKYIKEKNSSPTHDEIRLAVGLKAKSQVSAYLEKLERAKKIIWEKKIARGIRLPSKAGPQMSFLTPSSPKVNLRSINSNRIIPGLGFIAAGIPIEVPTQGLQITEPLFEVEVPDGFVPWNISPENIFALRVKGDSMRDAMLLDGDTVILHRTGNVQNGNIAAVYVNDEDATTLKKIRWDERGGVWLDPQNPSSEFKSKHYLADEVIIQGKLLAVLRLYS